MILKREIKRDRKTACVFMREREREGVHVSVCDREGEGERALVILGHLMKQIN